MKIEVRQYLILIWVISLSLSYKIYDTPSNTEEDLEDGINDDNIDHNEDANYDDDNYYDDNDDDDYDDDDDDDDGDYDEGNKDDDDDDDKKKNIDDYYDEGYVNTKEENIGHYVQDPEDKNSKLVFEDIMIHKSKQKNDQLTRQLWLENDEHQNDNIQMDGIRNTKYRWPSSDFPPIRFAISRRLSNKAIYAIYYAMREIEDKTCVGFRLRSRGDRNYILFAKHYGCWSYVGRQGGRQTISIGHGCEYKKIVEHEILHALGFWHEQSRPDRDQYVKIYFENIKPVDSQKKDTMISMITRHQGKAHNFKKKAKNEVTYFGEKYDYKSIMHYRSYAFSKNRRPTIKAKPGSGFSSANLGQPINGGLSPIDKKQINKMYKCGGRVYSRRRQAFRYTWARRRRFLGKKR